MGVKGKSWSTSSRVWGQSPSGVKWQSPLVDGSGRGETPMKLKAFEHLGVVEMRRQFAPFCAFCKFSSIDTIADMMLLHGIPFTTVQAYGLINIDLGVLCCKMAGRLSL